MAQKKYTAAEKAEYYRKLADGEIEHVSRGKKGRGPKLGPDGKPLKKSGCVLVPNHEYKGKNNGTGPMIWGWWRDKKHGFKRFRAYLSENMGSPKSGNEDSLVFIVNLEVEGLGELPPQTAVWSKTYKKLTMKGGMVANPHAPRGGYWGPGGKRRKKYVNQ